MKESYATMKHTIIEIIKDPNPLVLPNKSYPDPIENMPWDKRPCIHCGEMNAHQAYFGSIPNHNAPEGEFWLDTVRLELGFKCTNCGEENHAKDKCRIEVECSCCGGFTELYEGGRPIDAQDIRWISSIIEAKGRFIFDIEKHNMDCIAEYTESQKVVE